MSGYFDERTTSWLISEAKSLINLTLSVYKEELVPWKEFFQGFKAPQMNLRHIEQRITSNFEQYYVNYILLCSGIFGFRLIFSPIFLLTTLVTCAFSVYLLLLHKKPIVIGETVLNSNHKKIICAGVAISLFSLSGSLESIIWSSLYCVFICGVHLAFRPRSVTAGTKSTRAYDGGGGGGGGGGMNVNMGGQEQNSFDPESFGGSGGLYSAGSDDSTVRKRAVPGQESSYDGGRAPAFMPVMTNQKHD